MVYSHFIRSIKKSFKDFTSLRASRSASVHAAAAE
jgi:hypothetical protein